MEALETRILTGLGYPAPYASDERLMSEDRTGSGSLTARWLERLFPGMVGEPQNRARTDQRC